MLQVYQSTILNSGIYVLQTGWAKYGARIGNTTTGIVVASQVLAASNEKVQGETLQKARFAAALTALAPELDLANLSLDSTVGMRSARALAWNAKLDTPFGRNMWLRLASRDYVGDPKAQWRVVK